MTYAPAGVAGGGPPVLVDLRPDAEEEPGVPGPRPARTTPRPPWWLLTAVGVLAFAAWGLRPDTTPAAPTEARPTLSRPGTGGPVVIETASVVAPPWRGVFEHLPDARGTVSVPRVHVLSFAASADPERRALLVVDATRRAFGGPEGVRAEDRVRVIGTGDGGALRTLQWDAGGYGMSLTAAGLSPHEQDHLRTALSLPVGPSLQHGRAPGVDDAVLADLGLALTDARSGPASAYGSPLIGQSGGATIEAQLHQLGSRPLLVSVVQDQVVSAGRVRRALGPPAWVDVDLGPGVVVAAVLVHPGDAPAERRVRGWSRLLLDHRLGVTIELSSDDLGPDGLVSAAQALDLDRLARTVVPSR